MSKNRKKIGLIEKVKQLTGKPIQRTSAPATVTPTAQQFKTPQNWNKKNGKKYTGAKTAGAEDFSSPSFHGTTEYQAQFSAPEMTKDRRDKDAKIYANVTGRTESRTERMKEAKEKEKMDQILRTRDSSQKTVKERRRRANAAANKRGGRKKSRKKRRRRKTKRRRKKRKTKRRKRRKRKTQKK